jgi:hypothetical protein
MQVLSGLASAGVQTELVHTPLEIKLPLVSAEQKDEI